MTDAPVSGSTGPARAGMLSWAMDAGHAQDDVAAVAILDEEANAEGRS